MSRPLPAEPDLPEDDESAQGSGATITPYRDGPLIVRGDFRLLDQDGGQIEPGRETIALCRCGKSGIKPFCDGSHKRAGVLRTERAEPPAARADDPGAPPTRCRGRHHRVSRRVRGPEPCRSCPTMCGTSRRAVRTRAAGV